MNQNKLSRFGGLVLMVFSVFFISCDTDDGQKSCNIEYLISASINVNLPLYSEVETRGWTYVDGEGTGTRGLILVKTNNGYKAYDRNAPHICPTLNSTMEVVDDIKLYCPEDGAEWILLTGEPILIADRAPRVYSAVRNGDIISIFN
jgi:nitrite reductase/ring-hydroxylating ferredoxin subunit